MKKRFVSLMLVVLLGLVIGGTSSFARVALAFDGCPIAVPATCTQNGWSGCTDVRCHDLKCEYYCVKNGGAQEWCPSAETCTPLEEG